MSTPLDLDVPGDPGWDRLCELHRSLLLLTWRGDDVVWPIASDKPRNVVPGLNEHRAELNQVDSALRAIDERDATALRLIYGRRFTQTEVAAHLGVSELEIGVRVARGLCAVGRFLVAAPRAPRQARASVSARVRRRRPRRGNA